MSEPAHKKERGNGESTMKKNLRDVQKLSNLETGRPTVREQFSICCRICHSTISREKLISPCLCKGSLAFVHLTCLERWLNQSGRDTCELCTFRFEAEQTRRYSVCQGLRIWYRHPRHMSQLKADLVIGLVLTGVTLGLCSICIGGMKYFVLEGFRVGISYVWTEGVISFFLTVIVLGYFTTIYLMVRDHVVPWYHWWNRCVNVRLILDMDLIPSVDSTTVQINPSTETIMMPSDLSIIPIKMDRDPDDREKSENQNNGSTIIYIPDISPSSSIAQAPVGPPPRHQMLAVTSENPTIPSVMSAIMSHIIHTSMENSGLAAQNKIISKDSNNANDLQNQKICEKDSNVVIEEAASSVIKVSVLEIPDVPSVEVTQLSHRTSSDII